jgi:hypothetical protein
VANQQPSRLLLLLLLLPPLLLASSPSLQLSSENSGVCG